MNIESIVSSTRPLVISMLLVLLAACSNKPSPWAANQSPWEQQPEASRQVDDEPLMGQDMDGPVGIAGIDEAPMVESRMLAGTGDLASMPANHFTVQLVASSSMENLRFFARQNNLPDRWTARTNVNGKNWYVLLLGVYPTRGEAATALSTVRNRLDTTPWIRSMASLQSVLVR